MSALAALKMERKATLNAIDLKIRELKDQRAAKKATYDQAIRALGAKPAKLNARGRETRKKIRKVIFGLAKDFTTAEALEALPDFSRPTIHKELNAMVDDGAVIKNGRGKWQRVGA